MNLTRAVMEAYESREIPGSFPQFRLIDYVQEGPRFYYFFEESQVRKITTPPRRLHLLRGEDFNRSERIPTQEWVMDDYLRDRVVDNLRGMVPYGTLTLK